MGKPGKQKIIPAPDIDRLAKGIYASKIEDLKQQVIKLKEADRNRVRELKRVTQEKNDLEKALQLAQETNQRLREKLRKLEYIESRMESGDGGR